MKYTESTKEAFKSKDVIDAFEKAKKSGNKDDKRKLYVAINVERANFLRRKGWSNAAIAKQLDVTEDYVEKHIFNN